MRFGHLAANLLHRELRKFGEHLLFGAAQHVGRHKLLQAFFALLVVIDRDGAFEKVVEKRLRAKHSRVHKRHLSP